MVWIPFHCVEKCTRAEVITRSCRPDWITLSGQQDPVIESMKIQRNFETESCLSYCQHSDWSSTVRSQDIYRHSEDHVRLRPWNSLHRHQHDELFVPWWCPAMETLSALLALCEGSPVHDGSVDFILFTRINWWKNSRVSGHFIRLNARCTVMQNRIFPDAVSMSPCAEKLEPNWEHMSMSRPHLSVDSSSEGTPDTYTGEHLAEEMLLVDDAAYNGDDEQG